MTTTDLTAPQFTDETAAIAHLEASRWPVEVSCPHCGSLNVHRMAGKTQAGYFLCNDCRDKFTCRTGTVMERSHIPIHKWLLAIHLMSASKKGMSAHQLHRMLGVTYKSAWFLAYRIREAMKEANPAPMGGEGGQVQADETYYGNTSKRAKRHKAGYRRKQVVVALVDPGTGAARAFHMEGGVSARDVREILVTNASRKSTLVSDESQLYTKTGTEFTSHQTVWHAANEYVKQRRELFRHLQARHSWRLSLLQRATFAALSERVLVSLHAPLWPRRLGRDARCRHTQGHRRQAPDLSTASLSREH
jgi:transposase-like protein